MHCPQTRLCVDAVWWQGIAAVGTVVGTAVGTVSQNEDEMSVGQQKKESASTHQKCPFICAGMKPKSEQQY